MSPFASEGTYTSESREVAVSETWDTWSNPQSSSNIEVVDGSLQLAEAATIPDSESLHARYDFSEYSSGTSGFEDLTGNGYDLVNGSITGVGETINGVQAGEFDGTDDGVYTDTFSDIYPFTVSVVVRVDSLTNSSNPLVGQFSTDNMMLRYVNSISSWEINGDDNVRPGNSDEGVLLMTAVFADSGALLRFNGTELGSGSTGTGRPANRVAIGFRPAAADGYLSGAVAEMLVYPDIRSSSQISDVEAYLADKWGISI